MRPTSQTQVLKRLGAEIVIGDVTREKTIHGIAEGVDYVIHMATLGHSSNFTVDYSLFEKVNVRGTLNILDEALKAGAKSFIHCSSTAAMGICKDVPADERSECCPHHAYGKSKLQAEKEILKKVSGEGLHAVIVRFSLIYGPAEPKDMLFLARLARRRLLPRIGKRLKLTPLIHIDDAIQGLLLASEKGNPGQIYIITNEQPEPFDRIVKIIQRSLGMSPFSLYIPEWVALSMGSLSEKFFPLLGKVPPISKMNIESTLADRVFSIAKAKKELGFEPKVEPRRVLQILSNGTWEIDGSNRTYIAYLRKCKTLIVRDKQTDSMELEATNPCPACGSAHKAEEWPTRRIDGRKKVLWCADCGFGWQHPLPTPKEIHDYYSGFPPYNLHGANEKEEGFGRRIRRINKLMPNRGRLWILAQGWATF